jgi:hypothetical protein
MKKALMTRWRSLIGPAVVAATVLLLFGSALGSGKTLAFRDTERLYAPVRTLVDDTLRSGHLPLWNPYECMGKPLFAEGIHGVLSPVSLSAAWLFPGDVDFLEVAYLLAAALGAFALARVLGCSQAASAGAGLCYGLSGYVLSMTGNLVFLAGAASIPWVVAAARSAGAGAPFGPFVTAVATAVAFFSGDTQSAVIGVALGIALSWGAGGLRGAGRALTGATAGVLLAGVQVLASRAELFETTRGFGLEPGEAEQWPLHPVRMLEWIVPGLVRGELARVQIPEIIYQGKLPGTFAESVYLGAPALLLGGVGLASARAAPSSRRTAVVLTTAIAILLWIALGHHLGARQLLDYVPIWNRFRYSEKMMPSITLCLSAAVAFGIDRAAAARLPRAAVLGALGVALLSAMALGAVLFAPGATRRLFALDDEAASFLLDNLRSGLLHPLLLLGALLAVDRVRNMATPALFALVAVGAAAMAAPFGAHLGNQAPHEARSPLRFEAPPPGPRIAHPFERMLAPTASLDSLDTNALLLRTILPPAANVAQRIDNVDCYGALTSSRRGAMGHDSGDWVIRIARRFGLTHVVLVPPQDHAQNVLAAAAIVGGQFEQSLEDPPVEVWAVPHRPWAFFATSVVAAPTAEAARPLLAELTAPAGSDTVVVESPSAPPTSPGRVLAIVRGTEEVRIEAESRGPGLLVVNDAWWPGWRAWIDGREAEILPADLLVRAIPWPTGRHTVVMRYEPSELREGWFATGLGAIATGALAAYAIAATRRRRLGAPPSAPA